MSNQKETVKERLARLQREKEEAEAKAKAEAGEKDPASLVSQLTHEDNGEPDFSEIAKKLQERKEQEAKGENEDHVKLTIYVRKDIYDSFNALITKRGQQKQFVNQALSDFIQKKARELGID